MSFLMKESKPDPQKNKPKKTVSAPKKRKPRTNYEKQISNLKQEIEILKAQMKMGNANREFLIELKILAELFADKYAATKHRWKRNGCSEPDFKKYEKLKKMLSELL